MDTRLTQLYLIFFLLFHLLPSSISNCSSLPGSRAAVSRFNEQRQLPRIIKETKAKAAAAEADGLDY